MKRRGLNVIGFILGMPIPALLLALLLPALAHTHAWAGNAAARPMTGSVEIAQIAVSSKPGAKDNLHLFTKGHAWTFNNGAEFPGAKGSFRLGNDHQKPVGVLKYDFSGGGNYVEASCNVSIGKINALSFQVKSAHRQSILIRVIDHSDQCLQFYKSYSRKNQWQAFRVNLAHGSSMHWGGHNNGVIEFPIVTVSVGVNKP